MFIYFINSFEIMRVIDKHPIVNGQLKLKLFFSKIKAKIKKRMLRVPAINLLLKVLHYPKNVVCLLFAKQGICNNCFRYVAMMLHRLLREIAKDDKDLGHVNSANLGSSTDSMQSGLDSAAVDKSKQEEVRI